jgi:protein phosphatase
MKQLYDIIGDVHGCHDALMRLGAKLGYDERLVHPAGRIPVFVGDLINRGPDSIAVLDLVIGLVREGRALTVLGNHDEALLRHLRGEQLSLADGGLWKTVESLNALPQADRFLAHVRRLYEETPPCRILDDGALLVVHAGIEDWILARYRLPEEAERIGRDDSEIARFMLHGDMIGKSPEGKTLRRDWAADYHGSAFVVYGHTPQPDAVIRFNTVNIDTGAYRGGNLTALRWPERVLVSVPSHYTVDR